MNEWITEGPPMTSTLLQQAVEARRSFEAWYEADAMPCEADWFKRDPDAPDEYDSAHTQVAWKAWQAALQQQPEPVGMIHGRNKKTYTTYVQWFRNPGPRGTKLYTAPPALQQQEEPREVAGWKLVPLEPTEEMLARGTEHFLEPHTPANNTLHVYRAMLYASPSPQDFTLPMVEEGKVSGLSEFVRNATPERKAEVYGRVMDATAEKQQAVIDAAGVEGTQ